MDLSKPVNLKIVWVGPLIVQLNPDNLNLQGKPNKVRVIGGFELSRVKLVRKLRGGELEKVQVNGRFQLLRV